MKVRAIKVNCIPHPILSVFFIPHLQIKFCHLSNRHDHHDHLHYSLILQPRIQHFFFTPLLLVVESRESNKIYIVGSVGNPTSKDQEELSWPREGQCIWLDIIKRIMKRNEWPSISPQKIEDIYAYFTLLWCWFWYAIHS